MTNYKNYRIVPLGTFPMVKIMPPGSGDIPKALEGFFTTVTEARQAIDRSLDNLKTKRSKKNDTEESTSSH